MKRRTKCDVIWYDIKSKKKRPIAYSTRACNDLIVLLAQDNPFASIAEIQKIINYDIEAIEVLQKYIEKGYGAIIASEVFK